jgi:hypothetical protein
VVGERAVGEHDERGTGEGEAVVGERLQPGRDVQDDIGSEERELETGGQRGQRPKVAAP